MTEKMYTPKQRSYLMCDGCGYPIGWSKPRVSMTIHEKDTLGYMRAEELHFHLDPPVDPKSKTYQRDCVAYWWNARETRAWHDG